MSDFYEIRRLVKYGVLQTTTVPSLICDLLVFMYFIRHYRRELLNAPHNHVIFCLLMVSFLQKMTDTSIILSYLRWGTAPIQHGTFCLIWNWLDYSGTATCLHLLAWCSIERHFFVFHGPLMQKRAALIILHYIPMIISLVYLSSFYVVVMFLQTACTNTWDYSLPWCGLPCFVFFADLWSFDWLFHCAFPNILIVVVNSCLFGRIIWQKIKRQRPIQWRRQRKLIVQSVFISALYLIFYLPMVVVGVIQSLWSHDFLAEIQIEYFYFLIYFTTQFLPFVIAGQLPGLRREWRAWYQRLTQQHTMRTQIHPST